MTFTSVPCSPSEWDASLDSLPVLQPLVSQTNVADSRHAVNALHDTLKHFPVNPR